MSEGPQDLRATACCPGWHRNGGSGPAEARAFDTWKSLSGASIAPVPKQADRGIDLKERERALPPMTAAA
ncbi:hypothetical protein NK6_3703 [Bradyrhizobium diazoefficiens]|uniref:Uncharacterized protein n=1 Tax=Bradyrhizobium diazoefficiens TaxID=1355477 RepID=A0A0E4BPF6_9BRAD|nr:hypothetical protein NK6_3703 [Bradyrhizobium diazoefficiens]